jgi:hypothetical protein
MNNSELNTEKLIQYLDGDLTGGELEAFEKLLSENDELLQELKNLTLAKMAIRSYGLKSQVASVHQEMMHELKYQVKPSENKIYPFIRSTLKYAASVILILFSIGIYLYVGSSPSKLYKENYEPYELSIARGATTNAALDKAFNAGNYNAVISIFKTLTNPGNKEYFLAAQAYQSTHQLDKAIQVFNQVLSSPVSNTAFKDDAAFYLGLTYLENNQPVRAKPIFDKIYADQDHLYHDKVSYWTMLKLKLLTLKSSEK